MRISDWSSDVCSSDLLCESTHGASRDGGGLVFRAAALGPILQLDEGQAGALPLAVERETADRAAGFDVGFLLLEEVVVQAVQRLLSPGQRSARESLDPRDPPRLVFFGPGRAGDAQDTQRK